MQIIRPAFDQDISDIIAENDLDIGKKLAAIAVKVSEEFKPTAQILNSKDKQLENKLTLFFSLNYKLKDDAPDVCIILTPHGEIVQERITDQWKEWFEFFNSEEVYSLIGALNKNSDELPLPALLGLKSINALRTALAKRLQYSYFSDGYTEEYSKAQKASFIGAIEMDSEDNTLNNLKFINIFLNQNTDNTWNRVHYMQRFLWVGTISIILYNMINMSFLTMFYPILVASLVITSFSAMLYCFELCCNNTLRGTIQLLFCEQGTKNPFLPIGCEPNFCNDTSSCEGSFEEISLSPLATTKRWGAKQTESCGYRRFDR